MSTTPVPMMYCSICGQPHPDSELAHFGTMAVCANCKPAYAQRLREGAPVQVGVQYAGFWIRFVAAILDGIIMLALSFVLNLILPVRFLATPTPTPAFFAALGAYYLASIVIAATYEASFVSRLGGTPGKLALGLKVVRPDGTMLTLGRAYGRYFAKMLSGFTLLIGFIMAGIDSQKRALHDMIADTRVIKTRT